MQKAIMGRYDESKIKPLEQITGIKISPENYQLTQKQMWGIIRNSLTYIEQIMGG
jgi:hypothetical protein